MHPLIVVGILIFVVSWHFALRFEAGESKALREARRQHFADQERELELLAWNRRPHAIARHRRIKAIAAEARPK